MSKFTTHIIPNTNLSASDVHGGFELNASKDKERHDQLLEGLEQLRLSSYQDQNESLHTSGAFSPLLDVPVDTYTHSDSLSSSRALLPNWLLAENVRSDSSQTSDNGFARSDDTCVRSQTGRAAVKNSKSDGADVLFTVVDVPHHKRPLLSQVFGSLKKCHSSTVTPAGQSVQETPANDEPEFELTTVRISKTKQSLGIQVYFHVFLIQSKCDFCAHDCFSLNLESE